MQRYKPEDVRKYVEKIMELFGVSPEKAAITADVLVEADMRGIFSHGVNIFDMLVISSIKEGGTDPNVEPEDVTRNRDFPIRHIDAHGGLGHPTAKFAVEYVKELARKHGIGKVNVFNANHFGAAGVYSEEICKECDLAGRVYCTTPSVVRPYGGQRNRFGTNVISWSLPYNEGIITIDMATTIHAVSGVMKALIEGASLPFPVFDKNGEETTDPHRFETPADFLANGSMIPLGGLGAEKAGKADAGFKGSGLAMLIELDSVIGSGPSTFIDPVTHGKNRWITQTFEAWRIDTLFPRDDALQNISETIADIREYGGKDMLIPGEKEHRQRAVSLSEGIEYSAKQIERLNKLGKEVGLAPLAG